MVNSTKSKGMTLVEMLVVLVLLSLASTLVMQGYSTALQVFQRVKMKRVEVQPDMLVQRWIGQTLEGAQAALDTPRQFFADGAALSGFTHRALGQDEGKVARFSWTLQKENGETRLIYQEGDAHQAALYWVVKTWPTGTSVQWFYRNDQGVPVTEWPPEGKEGTIPSAILLVASSESGEQERWFFTLPLRTYPRNDYRDF